MSKSSRRKGGDGEREIARIIRDQLGIECERNLEQTRAGGCDLIIDGWAPEVKRAKRLELETWWNQARLQAEAADLKPVLLYRQDFRQWFAVVDANDLRPDIWPQRGMPVSMDLQAWIQWVREELNSEQHMCGERWLETGKP